MFKGLGDVGQLMKAGKELKDIQKKLKKMEASGSSGGGAVEAVVNGEYRLVDIKINPDLVPGADAKRIEKLILSAVNSAVDASKNNAAKEMTKITSGMNLPDMSKFLK